MIPWNLLQDQNPWWRDGAIRRARGYPVRRDLEPKILDKILGVDDRQATLLLGPRQVGKTILLFQIADDLLEKGWPPQNLTYFDFSDERITGEISAREVVESEPTGLSPDFPRVFLFDEIRGAVRWDRWLKQAVDARVGRIVVTDSAAGLLRTGSLESSQGRWDEVYMEGLCFRELARFHAGPQEKVEARLRLTPNLLHERYLAVGGFPEHVLADDFSEARRKLRADIVARAILRDFSGLGVDVQRIKNLLVCLIQDSGAEFCRKSLARNLDTDPRSVQDWLRLLLDTLLISSLECFPSLTTTGRSRTKIFATDPGLVSAFAALPVEDPEFRPRALEAAVYRHLRGIARETGSKLGCSHHQSLDMNFVLEDARGTVMVKVTGSPRVRPEKVESLKSAAQELGADLWFVIHGGLLNYKVNGVEAIASQEFLNSPFPWP